MKRIFYADDDQDDRELFVTAISSVTENSDVLLANDGSQLCKHLQEKVPPVPDFLFLDLNMPVKNGYDCLKEIKANPFYNSMRVIVLSTSCESHDIDLTYTLGADFYICKESSYERYKTSIKKAIDSPYLTKPSREEFVIN